MATSSAAGTATWDGSPGVLGNGPFAKVACCFSRLAVLLCMGLQVEVLVLLAPRERCKKGHVPPPHCEPAPKTGSRSSECKGTADNESVTGSYSLR